MKEKDIEPYIVDGKIFQVYKIGKEPMNNKDEKQYDYKPCFEECEKQLAKALLQMAKDRLKIEGLNSVCMFSEKGIRETLVKLHEAVVIIKELSEIDRNMMCQKNPSDRCKCVACCKNRASEFIKEVGIDLPEM